MSCQHVGAVHICSFTDFADLRIVAAGRSFRFEFSHRFGPALLDKRGEVKSSLPRQREPFWPALQLWCQQGHKVENGHAVYEIPAPGQTFVRLAGRQWVACDGRDPADVRAERYAAIGQEPPDAPPETMVDDEWAALRTTPEGTPR